MKRFSTLAIGLAATLALLCVSAIGLAQSLDDVEIGIEPVADNVYALTGRGGNIGLVVTVYRRLVDAIGEGKTLEEIQAMGLTAEYDEQWGNGFIPPDRWIALLHRGLTEGGGSHGHEH